MDSLQYADALDPQGKGFKLEVGAVMEALSRSFNKSPPKSAMRSSCWGLRSPTRSLAEGCLSQALGPKAAGPGRGRAASTRTAHFPRVCMMFSTPWFTSAVIGSPRGSKHLQNEYLAETIFIISYVEAQSPHSIGTWTLRVWQKAATKAVNVESLLQIIQTMP